MSMQFTFFALPEEQSELERTMEAVEPARWIAYFAASHEVGSLSPRARQPLSKNWFHSLLGRERDLERIIRREVPTTGEWHLDCDRSPVIELSRLNSDLVPGVQGRLYARTGYYDEQWVGVAFDESFIKWVRAVFRRVKTKLVYCRGWRAYCTPRAMALVEESGIMRGLSRM